jgi:hypothetical protein
MSLCGGDPIGQQHAGEGHEREPNVVMHNVLLSVMK